MKRVVSMILIFLIILSLSAGVFAKDGLNPQTDSIEIDDVFKENIILKDSYVISEDNIVSKEDGSQDKYSKSLNFLMKMNAIEIDSNGTIIDKLGKEISGEYLDFDEVDNEIDYDDVYKECINKTGDYYGIIPEKELINIKKHVDSSIPIDPENIIEHDLSPQSRIAKFDYYDKALRNTALVSYMFTSYKNLGYSEALAWLDAGWFFAQKVRSGGEWDYKRTLGTKTSYSCNLKTYYATYTGESIGNMHYGTVGSYLFKPGVLKSAAGLYQIYSKTAKLSWYKTYFDDPKDQADIQRGINLHSTFKFPSVQR